MSRSVRAGSLNLTLPLGQTVLSALVILAALLAALEASARAGLVLPGLLSPMVSGDSEVGPKLELLAEQGRREGPADCFVIGRSVVYRGIDPGRLAQSGSQPARCFNFGLSGLNIAGSARLARALVAGYHPRMIIYGISYRDVSGGFGLSIPWVNQQLGHSSLQGWLEDKSVAYRYALGVAYGAPPLYQDWGGDNLLGYRPNDATMDVSVAPVEGTPYYKEWQGFQIPSELQAVPDWLGRFLSVRASGTSPVVVEMPVPPALLAISGEGRGNYQAFIDQVRSQTESQGGMFIAAPPAGVIPADGWQDYIHLNRSGSMAYSQWLADQLADLPQPGSLSRPAP